MTFALTVFADLTVAVETGMILAALLFIKRVTTTTTVQQVTQEYVEDGWRHALQGKDIPDYVRIFRIHGPFLFGATDKLLDVTGYIDDLPQIVILRLRNMTAIDGTGLLTLEELADKLQESGRTLILCGAREQPALLMQKAEFEQRVGAGRISATMWRKRWLAPGRFVHIKRLSLLAFEDQRRVRTAAVARFSLYLHCHLTSIVGQGAGPGSVHG